MNTAFFIGGISGAGKSTRVYALVSYLDKLGIPYEDYIFKHKSIGRIYFGKLAFVGKVVQRGLNKAWQGLDSFSDHLGDGRGNDGLYDFMFNALKTYDLVIDTAILLRTNRSRPKYIKEKGYMGAFNSYVRFYYFEMDDFKSYQDRIRIRQNGKILDEKSSMWLANKEFRTYITHYNDELREDIPEEYKKYFLVEKGDPKEDVSTVGIEILKRSGHEDLIEGFKDFCKTFHLQTETDHKEEALF